MKRFLILLFLSYSSSDKLDLTYLPPPGSQYAGGRPEDIQTPLEYPKETYSTTFRPSAVTIGQTGVIPGLGPDDYEATVGINRIPSSRIQDGFLPQGSNVPINQNSFNVPSTTVSYAFTQTTTHPPTENFETTISPINPITGFPITAPYGVPSQGHQINQANSNQFFPNAQGNNQRIGDQSTPGPITQFPGSSLPSSNNFYEVQSQPGQTQFQQSFQQLDSDNKPGIISGGPSKKIGDHSSFVPVGEFTGPLLPSSNRFYGDRSQPAETQFQQGVNSRRKPGAIVTEVPLLQSQYPRNQSLVSGYDTQPGLVSSNNLSQGPITGLYPSSSNNVNTDNLQRFTTVAPVNPQSGVFNKIPSAYESNVKIPFGNNYPSRYSGSSTEAYQPTSSTTPAVSAQGFGNEQISGDFNAPVNYGGIDQGRISTTYVKRPERPQAEADRTAVILNYKNIITPEGFEYSFDTSNGIHADENGTAVDGVKAEGSYSYTGDDGKFYQVVYTADENGFRPYGDHLPTPPPVPEAIQRLIEKVKQDNEAGIFDDGSYDEKKYGHKNYQGPQDHYPQFQDKFTSSDNRLLNRGENYSPTRYQQGLKNQFPSSKKPTVDGFDKSQEQEENSQLLEHGITQPNDLSKPSSRPVNIFSDTGMIYQNSRKPTSQTLSSRPPVNKNRYGEEVNNENDNNQTNEQQSFNAQYPPEKDGRYTDDSLTGEENEPDVISDEYTRYEKESYRPQSQQQHQQNVKNRIQKPGSGLINNGNKNHEQKYTGRPVDAVRQTTVDGLENNTPANQLPSRRPNYQATTVNDELESTDVYDQNNYKKQDKTDTHRSKPNRLPSKYPTESIDLTTVEDKTTGIYSQTKPNEVNTPIINTNTKQVTSTRRRPPSPYFKFENVSPGSEESNDDTESYYKTEGGRPDVNSYPTPEFNDRFKVTKGLDSSSVTKGPQTVTTKYSLSRDRQQRPQTSYQNKQVDEERKDNIEYGQRLRGRPTVSPNANMGTNQELIQYKNVLNNTGYQYIPPRNRFNYEKGNNYSDRYPGTVSSAISTSSPQLSSNDNKDATAKPFMTPNVSRLQPEIQAYDYDGTTPDQDFGEEVISTGRPTIQSSSRPTLQATRRPQGQQDDEYEEKVNLKNYDQFTSPDYDFGEKVISTGRPSIQTTSRPTSQATRRPQYSQQYSTTPGSTYGTTPLFEKKYYQKESDTQTPYEISSSTTPASSQIPYSSSSKEILIPGQIDMHQSKGSDYQGRPINLSPTTSATFQKPIYGGSQGVTYDGSQRPNYDGTYSNENLRNPTYQPNQPTTPTYYDKISEFGEPSTGSNRFTQNRPKAEQNNIGNRLPSTTYRPNYTIKGDQGFTRKPILQLDDFGRPVVDSEGQDYRLQYTPSSEDSSAVDPQNSKYQYRPKEVEMNQPGQGQRIPGYQTSTQRILGEDFSGPKQQQRFDTKYGYYY